MDPLDYLAVRFHYGGDFFDDGNKLHYLSGNEAAAFIDRDKISQPEVLGHLRDHYTTTDPVNLHWVFPSKELLHGLRVLVDDQACLEMCQCIFDGGAADIFVELIVVNESHNQRIVQYMSSPEQIQKDVVGCTKYLKWVKGGNEIVKAKKSIMQEVSVNELAPLQADNSSGMDADSDHSYLPGDDESSEDDEEAVQIRADIKESKKKLNAKELVVVDEEGHEVNVENLKASNPWPTSLNDEGDSSDVNTDEDDDSYGETSDGEVCRKGRIFPRFDGSVAVPSFTVGMKFTDKSTFREAVIKYGLAEKSLLMAKISLGLAFV